MAAAGMVDAAYRLGRHEVIKTGDCADSVVLDAAHNLERVLLGSKDVLVARTSIFRETQKPLAAWHAIVGHGKSYATFDDKLDLDEDF